MRAVPEHILAELQLAKHGPSTSMRSGSGSSSPPAADSSVARHDDTGSRRRGSAHSPGDRSGVDRGARPQQRREFATPAAHAGKGEARADKVCLAGCLPVEPLLFAVFK